MRPIADAILRDFRDRRITDEEFERQMRPWREIDSRGTGLTIRYRQPIAAQVPVGPSDGRRALAQFAAGELSEPELISWATMLDMLPEFGPGADMSDEEADRLDPMWDVIIRVGSPPIFEALTPETVRGYDAKLQQLESELSEGAV